MASDKKGSSIPDWQKLGDKATSQSVLQPDAAPTTAQDILDHARRFLRDEFIKDAPREQKVEFLKRKGIQSDDITKLLASEADTEEISATSSELKTIHDSTSEPQPAPVPTPQPEATEPQEAKEPLGLSPASVKPRSDLPPIITYPEFLLKPEKPPPLITIDRLVNAAYVLAGVSALTYGASKYIVQPMLETLTEARHDFAESAVQDLTKLNTKLESTVSHVPYIASAAVLKKREQELLDLDNESVDSDPTELFHRDIATQTSPARSRSSSVSSSSTYNQPTESNPTAYQSNRLTSLHATLASLVASTKIDFAETKLKDTMSDLRTVLDRLESNAHVIASASTYNNPYSSFANSLVVSDEKTSTGAASKKKDNKETEAIKFKAEIRALKGAFLSSRNFPTARPAVPFTMPPR